MSLSYSSGHPGDSGTLKELSKDVWRNGWNYSFHPHAKQIKVPEIGSFQFSTKKGHCVGELWQGVVFNSMQLDVFVCFFCHGRCKILHNRWPSPTFVDILNKSEFKLCFCVCTFRRGDIGTKNGRASAISSLRYKDVRLGKADDGALSCHISISEGIVEESAKKLKGCFSTDWHNQRLFSGRRKKKKTHPPFFLSFCLFFQLHSARTPPKDEWLSGFHCGWSFLS